MLERRRFIVPYGDAVEVHPVNGCGQIGTGGYCKIICEETNFELVFGGVECIHESTKDWERL